MNEEVLREELSCAKQREERLKWVITTILVVSAMFTGFFGGVTYTTERLRDTVVTHTAQISTLEKGINDMNRKLDRVLSGE